MFSFYPSKYSVLLITKNWSTWFEKNWNPDTPVQWWTQHSALWSTSAEHDKRREEVAKFNCLFVVFEEAKNPKASG